ncbi:MAG TPA: LacI family DNA-binding transcriptional regulator [Thermomicrobiales bacterium]|nr:LacI family DNA-binding transcriptional regulator [Thermomicrobiales bacterium]
MEPKRRVTLKDVAARAGVSTAVVSYVINKGPRPTSKEVTERVHRAVEELDYHPNHAARGLRARRTHAIAIATYDFRPSTSFFSHYLGVMLAAMTEALHSKGYYLLLLPFAIDSSPARLRQLLGEGRVDAIAMRFVTDPPSSDSVLQVIAEAGLPCVCLERPGAARFGFPSVTYDDREGGRLAMEHLLGRGHRRIAHIHGDMRYASAQARLSSYERAMTAAGLEIDHSLIVGSPWDMKAAHEATQRLLALDHPPSAIFAASDDLALGAVQAIEHRGLSVPGDIAVVGFDDIPISEQMIPSLSTVRLPLEDMGRRVADLLTAETASHDGPRDVLLPVELIVRETS